MEDTELVTDEHDAGGPWPLPRHEWLLPLDAYAARVARRVELAASALLPQVDEDRRREAIASLVLALPGLAATDRYGNHWLLLTDRHGRPWARIATASVGLWVVPGRGACYCPDPLLDDDLVDELRLPQPGPWGDAGPLVPVEP
jgi:hypothetical protein